jgi:S1-C subfamily serine protease
LAVQDPFNPSGLPQAAKFVGAARELDLAIIQCPGLKVPPVPMNMIPVSRGAEVMAFGFAVTSFIGKGLKPSSGAVTGTPSDDTDRMIVLDISPTPGHVGGPVCDKSGRVVGVMAAKSYAAVLGQTSGLAVPTDDVMPFLKQYVRGYVPPKLPQETLEWSEIDAKVTLSTVLILVQKKK